MVYPSGSNPYIQAIWYVIAMKWMIEPAAIALGIIIVIVFVVILGGQFVKVQQASHVTPTPVPETPSITEIPTTVPETTLATPEPTIEVPTPPPITTPQGSYVVAATPYHDKKYYLLPYRSTIYDPRTAFLPPIIFQQSYKFDFQDEAVVAYIVNSPMIVDYTMTRSVSPTRTFFYLTVRNNKTQELLAQDGFYGPFSENSQKRYFFSSPGTYHINMYGGFISVDLAIRAPK